MRPEGNAHYLRSFQLLLAPALSFRIHRQFFGHLKAGITPVRNLEWLDAQHRALPESRTELEAGLFVRAGISLRIPNR